MSLLSHLSSLVVMLGCLSCKTEVTVPDGGPKTCPVHGDTLLEDLVPWVCGGGPLPAIPPGLGAPGLEYEWQAEQRDFPLAHTSHLTGCVWSPSMNDRRTHVFYCP